MLIASGQAWVWVKLIDGGFVCPYDLPRFSFLTWLFSISYVWQSEILRWIHLCLELFWPVNIDAKGQGFFPSRAILLAWGRKKVFIIWYYMSRSHSCFFTRNELLWGQRDQPPKDDKNQVKDWIPKFRFADLNRPRGVEWPVLFFVYWSCTAQVGSADELRGAFCADLQRQKLAEIWDIRCWIINLTTSFLSNVSLMFLLFEACLFWGGFMIFSQVSW